MMATAAVAISAFINLGWSLSFFMYVPKHGKGTGMTID